MAGGVFLIQKDESLVAMTEEPRRWLLISRETPIPVEEGGGWQFSLDHLFVDQDAVPTLVEVKRASDLRIRREVVGQMLDYAANANAHGPAKPLAEQFEERCAADGLDPGEEIANRLGEAIDPRDLWERANTNLRAGRMRLVFVADAIPPEPGDMLHRGGPSADSAVRVGCLRAGLAAPVGQWARRPNPHATEKRREIRRPMMPAAGVRGQVDVRPAALQPPRRAQAGICVAEAVSKLGFAPAHDFDSCQR